MPKPNSNCTSIMKTAIIGLGLIGGSLAKAIKTRTSHKVYGFDRDRTIQLRAKMVEAIDSILTPRQVPQCDLILLALYPDDIVQWLQENAGRIKPGAMVCDCGGIKSRICRTGFELARQHGFVFVGGHPMAGIERFGFAAAQANLFSRATMVLIPDSGTPLQTVAQLKEFFLSLGFSRIKITAAEEHDRVIAYTSQLAHILSSAYIKSDTAFSHTGISAGSFRDMTRVATLQPQMWTQLCMENREALLPELSGLIERLRTYETALRAGDHEKMIALFEEGCDYKARAEHSGKTTV